jgi:esterase/lipase
MISLNEDCIEYYPSKKPAKAITIVAHGLNLNPKAMMSIVDILNEGRSDVVLMKFYGHRGNIEEMKAVEWQIWFNEMEFAFAQAKKQSIAKNVPIYFVGYSLGGLVGQHFMQNSDGKNQFDRQVLFAPATCIRKRSKIVKLLFILGSRFVLPSFSPKEYRANYGTSVAAYKALFYMERSIMNNNFIDLNIPTLIFIDKKDELVNYKGILNDIDTYQLDQYIVHELNDEGLGFKNKYHHLIIDELSTGSNNWKFLTEKMSSFLELH